MAFNCTQCGLCCKATDQAFLLPHGLPVGPLGWCGHLTPDNRCAIYETRPVVCRVDRMRPPELSEPVWFALNEEACRELQELDTPPSLP